MLFVCLFLRRLILGNGSRKLRKGNRKREKINTECIFDLATTIGNWGLIRLRPSENLLEANNTKIHFRIIWLNMKEGNFYPWLPSHISQGLTLVFISLKFHTTHMWVPGGFQQASVLKHQRSPGVRSKTFTVRLKRGAICLHPHETDYWKESLTKRWFERMYSMAEDMPNTHN